MTFGAQVTLWPEGLAPHYAKAAEGWLEFCALLADLSVSYSKICLTQDLLMFFIRSFPICRAPVKIGTDLRWARPNMFQFESGPRASQLAPGRSCGTELTPGIYPRLQMVAEILMQLFERGPCTFFSS